MNRREFFGLAAASIFAPKFGRWYRQGSGLLVPATTLSPPGYDVFVGSALTLMVQAYGLTSVDFVLTDRMGRTKRVPAKNSGDGLFSATIDHGPWASVQSLQTFGDKIGHPTYSGYSRRQEIA